MKPVHLYPVMSAKPPFSVEVPGATKVEGEGIPRRHPAAKDGIWERPSDDVNTVWDIVVRSSQKYGDIRCVGWRKLIQMHKETKMIKKFVDGKETEVPKEWAYFEKSPFEFITYSQYHELCKDVASGFVALGLKRGDRIQIYAATSVQWLSSAHAAMSQGMAITTAYDTLGQSGLTHALVETGAKAIVVDAHLLNNLIEPLKTAKEVSLIIYNDADAAPNPEHVEKLQSAHPHLTILSWDAVKAKGKEHPAESNPSESSDLACIMYTSGSTGTPKGVYIKQSNVVAAIAGIHTAVGDFVGGEDTLLAYLPLAHILEFAFENVVLYWGGTLGYGSIRTLTDVSMKNCAGDIRELKPTVLVGVPQVWETVKKGVEIRVKQQPAFRQKLFWGAMSAKSFLLNSGLPGTSLLDAVVFSKIREATGGRLKVCFNGGGPLSKETQHFVSMAIAPMIIGYGLTETCANGCIMNPYQWTNTTLGAPVGAVEIKLVDYLDAGYSTASNPPQGEIWIRGPAVAEKYYNNEKETSEAYSDDGWFKTGDVGEWTPSGHLKIIDRKKNLVKTLHGEYIALEKLESVYRSCSYVQNICVYADTQKAKPVALIQPHEVNIKKLAADLSVAGELEAIVHDSKVQSAVLKDLLAVGRRGGLAGIELIDGVVIADDEWTPQSGLVTAAMKLNRRGLTDHYKTEIDAAYKKAGN
ncbi:long-chain fatty acid-CoA ligase, variant 2 [Orbilia oligospora]|uniref:Long-chain fatty acid-CoA ligase n=1 Tax=Orbilia oligospora TaxID=2813651 RepID=A0A7C8P1A6_ORBOL|nr:long-chain fatty acid-CoA ligase, variant 2 [Orbilia oligospora]KAF3166654.1 long-chain fatty acid-CoA ligase, variant 2 [Orbilia oligospora]KAF3244830.1 long-chain fatty acid-CoA ligase [Orbilia oligospora]KAF3246968.1 long-chain fatty acid-CoA ligase [Orbilia oligospora]KAF3246969.1 long-chain fatty acid-CoA ligase, variant 2 [Orbilia oligospora]